MCCDVPVDIGVGVLGLLQCMGDVALRGGEALTEQQCHQVAVAVVACAPCHNQHTNDVTTQTM